MDEALATRTAARNELKKLEAEITELAGHLNVASYRFLRLIAEFDRRKGWSDWATKSCAHQIVVHVDAETLKERSPGRCELEDGPSLPAETVRRLACEASVVEIVEDAEGEPLNVGRKTRSIPPAIRRAQFP